MLPILTDERQDFGEYSYKNSYWLRVRGDSTRNVT
jgi:hypothetical protein